MIESAVDISTNGYPHNHRATEAVVRAIAKRGNFVAQLHEGWLQAWGRPGQGSQFRLTLPRLAGGTLRASPLPLAPRDAALETVS